MVCKYFLPFLRLLFSFFRAALEACGSSQARSQIRAAATDLCYSNARCHIWAASVAYTTAHDNARSLNHWVRPGVEPTSSCILLRFITTEPQWELLFHIYIFFFSIIAGLQCSINFLLYSMVTQLHIHVYFLFSHIIMLHHKWLDIVPSATQQDLIAYPFQRQ